MRPALDTDAGLLVSRYGAANHSKTMCKTDLCVKSQADWTSLTFVFVILALVGIAYHVLMSKFGRIPGTKDRRIPEKGLKPHDAVADTKPAVCGAQNPALSDLKYPADELHAEHASAPRILAACYSITCKENGSCYSPTCARGRQSFAEMDVTIEKPQTVKLPKRERKMSIFSQVLSHQCGGFPTRSEISPTTVNSVFYLARIPALQQLKRLLEDRILSRYHRFSAIPIDSPNGEISWQHLETIDINAHICQTTVSSEDEVTAYINSLFGRVWDTSRPLWDLHILQNLNGRSALIFRLHHVMGDGISQMQILGDFVTDSEGNALTLDEQKFKRMMARRSLPATVFRKAVRNVMLLLRSTRALAKVATLPSIGRDSGTALKTPAERLSVPARVFIAVPPVSLAMVKQIKDALGVTVNDVLLAALGGAFRWYLRKCEDPLATSPSLRVRALMPYSFPRPLDDLHNKWTLISAQVPIQYSDPLARCKAAKATMDVIKRSPEPYITAQIQEITYKLLGHELSAQLTLDMFQRHTCVFTNVPGFQEQIYICGEPVLGMQPAVANAITQVSAVSYNCAIWMNFVVDEGVVAEPTALRDLFVEELETLAKVAGAEGPVILDF